MIHPPRHRRRRSSAPVLVVAALAALFGSRAQAEEALAVPAAAPVAEPAAPLATIPVTPPDTPAAAGTPAARQLGVGVEEIIVTAQKREESINDVPLSITAISGSDLAALGISDTRDLSKVTPGFTVSNSGVGTPVYTLRGVGFNDQSFFASPTVSVYVDEVPLPFSFMTKGANLDLQRVEVLKGPQGTLYGRNTTGGAINYIANKPTDSFASGITASYSRFQTTEVEGFISGPLTDTIKGRLALKDVRSQQGWQNSVSRPDDHLGKLDKQAARGILEWQPSETLSFRLSADGWLDGSDAQAPQPIAVIPQNPFTGAAVQSPKVQYATLVPVDSTDPQVAEWGTEFQWKLHDRYYGVALNGQWQFSDTMKLTSISSYGEARSDGSMLPAGLNAQVSDYRINALIRTLSQELRVSGGDKDTLSWMLGANYAHDQGNQHNHAYDRDVSSAFPVLGIAPVFTEVGVKGDTRSQQASLFANGDWQLLDTLKLTLGARYNHETTDFKGCAFDEPTTQGTGLAPLLTAIALTRGSVTPIGRGECFTLDAQGKNTIFTGTLTEHNVSGRTTLDWTPQKGLLFYVSFARGYKSGGFPVLPASNQSQYTPVKQEELNAWEVGSKLTLFDGGLQLNLAAFDYDYTNKQLLTRTRDPFFGPLPILQNAPKSKVQGGEISLSSTPLNGLFLSTAATYVETKIKEFESLDINGDPTNFAGRPFNYSPKVQLSALADYSWPLSDALDGGVGVDYTYASATNATLEGNPLYKLESYGLWNLRARIGSADKRWSAMLWGRNITNEFQAVNVYSIADVVGRYTGMPRTYGITLSYQFAP